MATNNPYFSDKKKTSPGWTAFRNFLIAIVFIIVCYFIIPMLGELVKYVYNLP